MICVGGGLIQLRDYCDRSWCYLLKPAVKTVSFPSKIMHDKVLIIRYSVVTVIVRNYIEDSLENKWCS